MFFKFIMYFISYKLCAYLCKIDKVLLKISITMKRNEATDCWRCTSETWKREQMVRWSLYKQMLQKYNIFPSGQLQLAALLLGAPENNNLI